MISLRSSQKWAKSVKSYKNGLTGLTGRTETRFFKKFSKLKMVNSLTGVICGDENRILKDNGKENGKRNGKDNPKKIVTFETLLTILTIDNIY